MKRYSITFLASLLFSANAAIWAQNFGTVKIGASITETVTVPVTYAGTLGGISVRLLGVENLDFTNAGGGTCTVGTAYTVGATCTVKVAFAPKFAGAREGAVVLFSGSSGSGTEIGIAPVYGVGSGPQIAYGPTNVLATSPGGSVSPIDVAVDGAGDLFILYDGLVIELPSDGGPAIWYYEPNSPFEALTDPSGMAVDSAGDLFIADSGNNRVVEVLPGEEPVVIAPVVAGMGLLEPRSVAVDEVGDLFIADTDNNRVVEIPAKGGAPIAIDPIVDKKPLLEPWGAAVSAAGDLFIADAANSRVVEVPADGSAPFAIDPDVEGHKLNGPSAVAVDGVGDLFIADSFNNRIVELPTGGGAPLVLDPPADGVTMIDPMGVAVDALGNVFVADSPRDRVLEILHPRSPALSFKSINVGATSADSPQTLEIENIGNQPLIFTSIAYPRDFPEGAGDSQACVSSASLGVGATCELPVTFHPKGAGALSEAVTLVDNASGTGSTQSVPVTGAAIANTAIVSLSSSVNPSQVGGTLEFSVTVSGGSDSTTPTGTVTILDGNVQLAVETLSGGTVSYSTQALTRGTHFISATYSGDANYSVAKSQSLWQIVGLLKPSLTLVSSVNPVSPGSPVVFTAIASGIAGRPTPTGSIDFYAESTLLGSVSLNAGAAAISTTFANAGASIVTAIYLGDSSYGGASSNAIDEVTNPYIAADFGSVKTGGLLTAKVAVLIPKGGMLGNISVRTGGVENLEFREEAGGTCEVGVVYAAMTGCSVQVKFSPSSFGQRSGAIVLTDSSASQNVLGTAYLVGNGLAAQIDFAPATASGPVSNCQGGPIALDGAGNLYLLSGNSFLKVVPAGQTFCTGTSTYTSASDATGIAVDGAGNVFVLGTNLYKEALLPNGSYSESPIASGFGGPASLAVDGNGNLYVADDSPAAVYKETLQADGSYRQSRISSGWQQPGAVAVDGSGNVYVLDIEAGSVVKETPVPGGYAETVVESGLSGTVYSPSYLSMAADVLGNVYVSEGFVNGFISPDMGAYVYGGVDKLTPSGNGYTSTDIYDEVYYAPMVQAVDGSGNVFLSTFALNSTSIHYVTELSFGTPPELSFASTALGSTSADSPHKATIQSAGNLPLVFSAISYPTDFPEAAGDVNACAAAQSLAPGQGCDLNVEFQPRSAGALAGKVTLQDNALNTNGAQTVGVGGTGLLLPTVTLAASSNPAYVWGFVTFTATVKGRGPTPTSYLNFYVNGSLVGKWFLIGETAQITYPFYAGIYTVTATYVGDGNYAPASSNTLTETVVKYTPKVVARALPNPASFGTRAIIAGAVFGGGPMPTGNLYFSVDGVSLGKAAMADGSGDIAVDDQRVGTHTIGVLYRGDENYLGVNPVSFSLVIAKAAGNVTLEATPNPVAAGAPLTLKATIEEFGGAVPNGTVKFFADGKELGVVTMSAGAASYKIGTLAAGSHTFVAEYSGNGVYASGEGKASAEVK